MMDFYADGGSFMSPTLGAGLAALALIVLQHVLKSRVNLKPAVIGSIAQTTLVGALGTLLGVIESFEATASAPPEQKQLMLAASLSISLIPLLFATILVSLSLIVWLVLQVKDQFMPRA